jgi:hypothetical protein
VSWQPTVVSKQSGRVVPWENAKADLVIEKASVHGPPMRQLHDESMNMFSSPTAVWL